MQIDALMYFYFITQVFELISDYFTAYPPLDDIGAAVSV